MIFSNTKLSLNLVCICCLSVCRLVSRSSLKEIMTLTVQVLRDPCAVWLKLERVSRFISILLKNPQSSVLRHRSFFTDSLRCLQDALVELSEQGINRLDRGGIRLSSSQGLSPTRGIDFSPQIFKFNSPNCRIRNVVCM